MTLRIDDTSMISDQTAHTARHAPDRNGWEVSWLPGQTLDRNSAITAMILADTAAERDLAGCPRPARSRTCLCTSASSTTASLKPTAAAPSSTTSPPGGWPSG